jgi:histidinol phosphatase-like PHP family hydrolase
MNKTLEMATSNSVFIDINSNYENCCNPSLLLNFMKDNNLQNQILMFW